MEAAITGGPNCGKTSLVNALAAMGYQVVPESAELAIKDMSAEGVWNPQKKDCLQALQHRLFEKQLELEQRIDRNRIPIFFDRHGTVEQIAYCGFYGLRVSDSVKHYVANRKFDRVYLLERVPKWENNGIRYEDYETGRKIHAAIAQAYEEQGHQVVKVPLFKSAKNLNEKEAIQQAIAARAEFILKDLGVLGGYEHAAGFAAIPV